VRGQPSEVVLKDSTFIRGVNIFLDSIEQLSFKEKTVVVVTITKLESVPNYDWSGDHLVLDPTKSYHSLSYKMTLSLERDLSYVMYGPPAFMFELRRRTCFIEFNVEDLFELTSRSRESILREAGKSVNNIMGSSGLAFMEINVQGKEMSVGQFVYGPNGKGK